MMNSKEIDLVIFSIGNYIRNQMKSIKKERNIFLVKAQNKSNLSTPKML